MQKTEARHMARNKFDDEIEMTISDITKLKKRVESAASLKYDFPGRIDVRHLWNTHFRILWWVDEEIRDSRFITTTETPDGIVIEDRSKQ